MPGTTPRGYPYPLPTEPVAEGAAAIRALAEAVETKAETELVAIDVGSATAGVAPGSLVCDFGTFTFDGATSIEIVLEVPFVIIPTSGQFALKLYDAATGTEVLVTRLAYWKNDAGAEDWLPYVGNYRLKPSAGPHRYILRFQNDWSGTPTFAPLDSQHVFARMVRVSKLPGGVLRDAVRDREPDPLPPDLSLEPPPPEGSGL